MKIENCIKDREIPVAHVITLNNVQQKHFPIIIIILIEFLRWNESIFIHIQHQVSLFDCQTLYSVVENKQKWLIGLTMSV